MRRQGAVRRSNPYVSYPFLASTPLTPTLFQQKRTLATHHAVVHLGRRAFTCAVPECGAAFGYKHLLQRHAARVHGARRSPDADGGRCGDGEDADEEVEGGDGDEDEDEEAGSPPPTRSPTPPARPSAKAQVAKPTRAERATAIDVITGKAYAAASARGGARLLRCPYPAFDGFAEAIELHDPFADSDAGEDGDGRGRRGREREVCEFAFRRAYDVRRHLRGAHGVELGKEAVDAWARGVRG